MLRTVSERVATIVAIAIVVMVIGASAAPASTRVAQASPRHGGTLTQLVPGETWPTLDVATDSQDAANAGINGAIDGTLFEQGSAGSLVPDIALGYAWSNKNLTFTVTLRPGVKFQDGTPVNAKAIVFDWNRDLLPSNACLCLSNFAAVSSMSTQGTYKAVMHLKYPDAALAGAFFNNAPNWPQSPTALGSESLVSFGLHPIGAGPFEVVSDEPGASLDLTRNPHYWEKGHPYLSGVDFLATSNDESDYSALESGEAEVSTFSTTSIIEQAKSSFSFKVDSPQSVNYEFVALNSRSAPFNNLLAREILSYATNAKQLVASIYSNLYPLTEAPIAAGTDFFEKKYSAYLGYNPTKAKALLAEYQTQTGSPFPTVQLFTAINTPVWVTEASAIAQQWEQVGIQVQITPKAVTTYAADMQTGAWSVFLTNGVETGVDPSFATPAMFGSTGFFSGTTSPALDGDLQRAAEIKDPTARQRFYNQIFNLLDQNAYAIPLYQKTTYVVLTKNVMNWVAPTGANAYYENVWLK